MYHITYIIYYKLHSIVKNHVILWKHLAYQRHSYLGVYDDNLLKISDLGFHPLIGEMGRRT